MGLLMMELLRRISYLWNRRRLEREMAEEMAYHRELMSPDRRTNFGDELCLREDAREICCWTWLDRLHQDLTIRRPRAPQCPRLQPHGDAGSGSGHRRPVERLSCGADRPSSIRGRVGTRPGFARASDAPPESTLFKRCSTSSSAIRLLDGRQSGLERVARFGDIWTRARDATRGGQRIRRKNGVGLPPVARVTL
jgi:hypothetical protein